MLNSPISRSFNRAAHSLTKNAYDLRGIIFETVLPTEWIIHSSFYKFGRNCFYKFCNSLTITAQYFGRNC